MNKYDLLLYFVVVVCCFVGILALYFVVCFCRLFVDYCFRLFFVFCFLFFCFLFFVFLLFLVFCFSPETWRATSSFPLSNELWSK